MVANMAFSVNQPQHAPSREGAPDPHRYSWLLKADLGCKADGSHTLIPSPEESSPNLWDGRTFPEDASSLAAGIWPPRAYPCSFCRREFRSAQALGGHMNVHRRDRARLRHSSPPPPLPFHAAHNSPLHPATAIMQKSQHEYSSTTSLNPTAGPGIYPNESLAKFNVQQTALPLSTIYSPQSSTSSRAARYPPDMAASFPLRLHLLASEAASTLMLPQAESLDLLSLWPASALNSSKGCHSSTAGGSIKGSAIDGSSWSILSSSSSSSPAAIVLNCPVSPSRGASTPCKRVRQGEPSNQVEDESPGKKSNVTSCSDFQPYQGIKLKNSSKEDETSYAHDKQILEIEDNGDESIVIHHGREVCNEFVDLELRLGQRPH